MRPVQGGRRCDRCDKSVIDLTRMSRDRALATALVFGGRDKLCGRMRADENGDAVFSEPKKMRARLPMVAAALSLGAGCASATTADVDGHDPTHCDPTVRIVSLPPAPPSTASAAPTTDAPLRYDADADGVEDKDDMCPTEAASAGSSNGCPVKVVVIVAGDMQIMERVTFRTGSAAIDAVHKPLLDEAAGVLLRNPQIRRLAIVGNADFGEPAPEKVSRLRAQAVADYLVAKGVDAARLEPRAAGISRPLVPKEDKANRDRNRRVDFEIVDGP